MMLSEGKTTIGNLFTLREGNLDLYLDRETYERAGLEGKPYGIKGGRGSKPRWSTLMNFPLPLHTWMLIQAYRSVIQPSRRIYATWQKKVRQTGVCM